MELTKVTCNGCGAPLEIPPSANFVTCRYCHAQLQVKRTESTIFTEVLNRIDQRTAAMADDLDAIRRDNEIERLDREWSMRQSSLMTHNKDGSTSAPSTAGGLAMIFIMGGFGIFWTIGAFWITTPDHSGFGPPTFIRIGFPCFGVVFVIAAIVGGIKMMTSADTYQQELQRYQQRRQTLLRQTQESTQGTNQESRI